MLDTELRMKIAEHLDAIRALLIPSLEDQIIAALRERAPLTMKELVEATGAELSTLAPLLTTMHRTGTLTRTRVSRDTTQRKYFAYEVKK